MNPTYTSRQLSGLIVNITNPAVLICSAFDDAPKASLSELALGLGVVFISYIALLAAAYLIPLRKLSGRIGPALPDKPAFVIVPYFKKIGRGLTEEKKYYIRAK